MVGRPAVDMPELMTERGGIALIGEGAGIGDDHRVPIGTADNAGFAMLTAQFRNKAKAWQR